MAVEVTPTYREFCRQHRLSPGEGHILSMTLAGKTNKEIASARRTSEQVVKNQMRFVYLKLKIEGDINGKAKRAMILVNTWARTEKRRRIRKQMNV